MKPEEKINFIRFLEYTELQRHVVDPALKVPMILVLLYTMVGSGMLYESAILYRNKHNSMTAKKKEKEYWTWVNPIPSALRRKYEKSEKIAPNNACHLGNILFFKFLPLLFFNLL